MTATPPLTSVSPQTGAASAPWPMGTTSPQVLMPQTMSLADSVLSTDEPGATSCSGIAVSTTPQHQQLHQHQQMGQQMAQHGSPLNASSSTANHPNNTSTSSTSNQACVLTLQNVPLELVGGELEQTLSEFGELDGPPTFELDPHSGRPTGVAQIRFKSPSRIPAAAHFLATTKFYAQSIRVGPSRPPRAATVTAAGGNPLYGGTPGTPHQSGHAHLRGSRIVLSASSSMNSSLGPGQGQNTFLPNRAPPQHHHHHHHHQQHHQQQQQHQQQHQAYAAPYQNVVGNPQYVLAAPQQVSPTTTHMWPHQHQPPQQQHHQHQQQNAVRVGQYQQPPASSPQPTYSHHHQQQQPHQHARHQQSGGNAPWAEALPSFQPQS